METYYEVKPGKNLLETCLSLGIYVPHFCYHGALGSVGACRLCAVKKFRNTDDQTGRIMMSCMEPAADGLIINVNDPEAVAFRAAIIESLMINHPHDCPVCDEGGECHLQDMTVMTGHNYRRFDFKKRTYTNQELGPFINHEMNRCIQCYRCVRFYNDYAGGNDLAVFGAHDHVYFGRYENGTLESEFSGNLVEVCPTGVFTDKTLKEHYTRKWDLTNAPSVCVHCSAGCNTIAGERYGGLRRIMSRYNGAVNGYFLCDRGRFGYEFVNDDQRIKKAEVRIRKDGQLAQSGQEEILEVLTRNFSGTGKWIGIGSPRASLEANFALTRLVGKENFFHGVSKKDYSLINKIITILNKGTVRSPSLKEIEKADAVLILGEDLTNTAPMTALAVRQASRNAEKEMAVKEGIPEWNDFAKKEKAQGLKIPVFIATSFETKLEDIAETTVHAAPMDIATLGFSIASMVFGKPSSSKKSEGSQNDLALRIADALKAAKVPLIISGTHPGNMELIHAATNIAEALSANGQKPMLSFILPECNSMGLGMMEGEAFEESVKGLNGEDTGLIVLENDLYRRADKDFVDSLMKRFNPFVVLDHSVNGTTVKADILLPVGTFTESEGTLVNNEGRAQRFYRVFPPGGSVIESWRQIRDLIVLEENREEAKWVEFDDVVNAMTDQIPAFAKIKGHTSAADFNLLNEKIKRQTLRFSGRTAINTGIAVSEPKIPDDPGSPLTFSMEGREENPPSSLVSYYWVPGWNSYQAVNFYLDEPNGSMKGGDPGIRLIEPSEKGTLPLFDPNALPFEPGKGEWLLVPAFRIFGSEELSSKSRPIKERIDIPFILMNDRDAAELGGMLGDRIRIKINDQTVEVTLRIDNKIPSGLAAVSAGLPGMPFMDLPDWGTLQIKKS
jgi:NADH-quinone oxidoreductase subunit G